mmetsp:Transcript_26676/g.71353  ORF Transcript_26676/g.71353 Transcript_26676/m.71353 type:complete len:267 (+) Transcript_26676:231-1031(+)
MPCAEESRGGEGHHTRGESSQAARANGAVAPPSFLRFARCAGMPSSAAHSASDSMGSAACDPAARAKAFSSSSSRSASCALESWCDSARSFLMREPTSSSAGVVVVADAAAGAGQALYCFTGGAALARLASSASGVGSRVAGAVDGEATGVPSLPLPSTASVATAARVESAASASLDAPSPPSPPPRALGASAVSPVADCATACACCSMRRCVRRSRLHRFLIALSMRPGSQLLMYDHLGPCSWIRCASSESSSALHSSLLTDSSR